jgi:hypothetical protein
VAWAESNYWWLVSGGGDGGWIQVDQPVDGSTQPVRQAPPLVVMPNSCEVTAFFHPFSSTPDLTLRPRNASSTALGPTCTYALCLIIVVVYECGEHVPHCRMHTVLPRCACDNNPGSSFFPILPSYSGHLAFPCRFILSAQSVS